MALRGLCLSVGTLSHQHCRLELQLYMEDYRLAFRHPVSFSELVSVGRAYISQRKVPNESLLVDADVVIVVDFFFYPFYHRLCLSSCRAASLAALLHTETSSQSCPTFQGAGPLKIIRYNHVNLSQCVFSLFSLFEYFKVALVAAEAINNEVRK